MTFLFWPLQSTCHSKSKRSPAAPTDWSPTPSDGWKIEWRKWSVVGFRDWISFFLCPPSDTKYWFFRFRVSPRHLRHSARFEEGAGVESGSQRKIERPLLTASIFERFLTTAFKCVHFIGMHLSHVGLTSDLIEIQSNSPLNALTFHLSCN